MLPDDTDRGGEGREETGRRGGGGGGGGVKREKGKTQGVGPLLVPKWEGDPQKT